MKQNKKVGINAIEKLVNEVNEVLTLTVEQILDLPEAEQEKAFAVLESSDKVEAELIVQVRRESKVFLRGAEQLGLVIYNNSVNKVMTSTVVLFKVAQQITNSIGKVVKMKLASFNRTFGTSLTKLYKNRKYNETRKEEEKREIEQIAYFDNINETLKLGSEKPRFTEMFKNFDKAELIKGVEVYTKTVYSKSDNNTNTYNLILVKPNSLPLFKTWLKFKGAKFEVATVKETETQKVN